MPQSITEALAEIKTISKRLEKKREFVLANLGRMDGIRDPFEAQGGAVAMVRAERQAIGDLEARVVAIRHAIARANSSETLVINGVSRSIADWLAWRREVAPGQQAFLGRIRQQLGAFRSQARQHNFTVLAPGQSGQMNDITLHVDELGLAKEIDQIEDTLGQLDGLLSLKNATVIVD
jgi:hypothetical protein